MMRVFLRQLKAQRCRLSTRRKFSSHIISSPLPSIDVPNKLIPEMVWETVSRFPDLTAVKCGVTGRRYTFAEVQRLSYRFANSLHKAGFSRGDVVAVVVPNCPEYPVIVLGALEAGLRISFMNHNYTADEMCHQLLDSGSVCVVAAPEVLATVLSAISKAEVKSQSKNVRSLIVVDILTPEALPAGTVRFSEMVGEDVDSMSRTSLVQAQDLACMPYSSGTTGLPKGVCLSHQNIVINILQSASLEAGRFNSGANQDIVLGFLPFYHGYGLCVILFGSLIQGSQVVTLPKFESNTFISVLEKVKVTVMMLVPPVVLFLGQSDKVHQKHLSHVRIIFSAAAPLGAADMARVQEKLPPGHNCAIVQGYGLTELSPIATVPPLPVKNFATVGVPVPNTLAKVVDPDTGNILGVNMSGELYFKGPQVMLGYYKNPKATSETIDSEGWLKTGDVGYYDEDGHLYIKDRIKELIKVKGFQVAPAELEEVLRDHGSVSDAGVIGVPCPRNGEKPVAYIVARDNEKLTDNEIRRYLSKRLSSYKQVSEIIFVDSIPKSPSGKILRRELRRLYETTNGKI